MLAGRPQECDLEGLAVLISMLLHYIAWYRKRKMGHSNQAAQMSEQLEDAHS